MNILGIGGYSHDSAAALVCDGRLVAAVAEERLTRVKHQGGPPKNAAAYCLESAGLTPRDVDHVTAYMKPGERIARRLAYRLRNFPRAPFYSAAYAGYEIVHNARFAMDMRGLRGPRAKLHFMAHHPAHAASAFLVSPFDEAALLSIDYIGEWTSTWQGIGRGTTISPLHVIDYPHSLGVFYSAITDYLGFQRASDEYKVMGLAPYGEPEFYDDFSRIVCANGRLGDYKIDLDWTAFQYRPGSKLGYFSDRFVKHFGRPRAKGGELEARHRNIAASAQKVLEETVLRMARALHDHTGQRNLCLAGGVALNCSMNGRLLREGPFDRIFIQPAAGDDGIAIGGAMQLYHELTGAPRAFELCDARLGPEFSAARMRGAIEAAGLDYATPADLEGRAADLIAAGNIVGWFQDRAEFGPRALGARSILADPTRVDMKERVNSVVKHREGFRPFAPSCIEERASDFFEGCGHSPFMLFVHEVAPDKRALLPATTHVDGTARVQTVSAALQPRYHRLLCEFERRRGVPIVLNTSFNVMGEPIVNSPEDAIRCFLGTGIDALVLGDYIIVKRAP
jgi:carbamoyltransferase